MPISDELSLFSLDNLIIIYIRMSICWVNTHACCHAYRMDEAAECSSRFLLRNNVRKDFAYVYLLQFDHLVLFIWDILAQIVYIYMH